MSRPVLSCPVSYRAARDAPRRIHHALRARAEERERSRRAIRRDPAGSEGRGRGVINEAPGAARGISLRLGLGGPIKPLIGLARFLRALERSCQRESAKCS